MKLALAVLLLCVGTALAQAPATLEQRLGSLIGTLIVENNRLVMELEAARAEIARLRAERHE